MRNSKIFRGRTQKRTPPRGSAYPDLTTEAGSECGFDTDTSSCPGPQPWNKEPFSWPKQPIPDLQQKRATGTDYGLVPESEKLNHFEAQRVSGRIRSNISQFFVDPSKKVNKEASSYIMDQVGRLTEMVKMMAMENAYLASHIRADQSKTSSQC